MAWIKVKIGEQVTKEEITVFCRGEIAYYKIPRYVKFVDAFPNDRHRQNPEIPDAKASN